MRSIESPRPFSEPRSNAHPEQKPQTRADRLRATFQEIGAAHPEWILKIGALSAVIAQACAKVPARIETGETPEEAKQTSVETARARTAMTTSLIEQEHLSPQDGTIVAEKLLWGNALPERHWATEKAQYEWRGGSQSFAGLELLPADISAVQLETLVSALPKTWTAPDVNAAFTFQTHEAFTKKFPKTETIENGKTACISHFSPIEKSSAIDCDTDVLAWYGWKKALRETLFHELAHSASPTRLPLPPEIKHRLWSQVIAIATDPHAPQTRYLTELRKATVQEHSAEAYAVLYAETFAEYLSAALISERAATATSWETWSPAIEEEFQSADYHATTEQAHAARLLIQDYFSTAAEHSFEPWTAAKTINTLLPKEKAPHAK